MSTSVTMPALGESVTEGTVTRWLKQEGDEVAADEPLLEVSTDKVDTEIPSPAAGVLQRIVVGEDETVAVGAELAVIGDGQADGGGQQGQQDEQQHGPAAAAGSSRISEPAAAASRISSRRSRRPAADRAAAASGAAAAGGAAAAASRAGTRR